ncbi:MAG: hypothetical protein M3388_07280 [Acidobacteriota bacterium]|nr:hypothetical protein [Acidobacteriota bacterium]
MQTLTAGSFLNLENASTVEALKFTARRLAEHTANVVAKDLNAPALENLANSLWEKAEYVARETERRWLHQLFNENFSERFRELKPEAAEAQKSGFEFPPADSTIEIAASEEQSPAPVSFESDENESPTTDENVSSPVSPEEFTTVAEGKRDEFLGFVESGEPFGDVRATTATTIAQADDELTAEPSKTENQSTDAVETLNSASQSANAANTDESPSAGNSNHAKTEAMTVAASAEREPITMTTETTSAGKNGANAVADGREPFEFEKCTINLNLTLLPMESGKNTRKVIIGAASHNLPPEIDFLEITEGGDLTQIAALVGEKLARFKQTLPVKYIEQLRASKNKSAKKPAIAKAATAAVPTRAEINQAKAEKPSGEQKTQETKRIETEKPQSEAATEKNNTAASTAQASAVNQSGAANSIQGSLF